MLEKNYHTICMSHSCNIKKQLNGSTQRMEKKNSVRTLPSSTGSCFETNAFRVTNKHCCINHLEINSQEF